MRYLLLILVVMAGCAPEPEGCGPEDFPPEVQCDRYEPLPPQDLFDGAASGCRCVVDKP